MKGYFYKLRVLNKRKQSAHYLCERWPTVRLEMPAVRHEIIPEKASCIEYTQTNFQKITYTILTKSSGNPKAFYSHYAFQRNQKLNRYQHVGMAFHPK